MIDEKPTFIEFSLFSLGAKCKFGSFIGEISCEKVLGEFIR